MKDRKLALKHLLGAWDGGLVLPINLEAVVEKTEVSNAETIIDRLKAATLADFGDVSYALAALPSLTTAEILHLARRLGWTVNALTNGHLYKDRSILRIWAALASAAAWDDAGSFWEAVRPRLDRCYTMIVALETVVRSRVPQARIPYNAPVWEREHMQALLKAEQACDWAHLGERAQAFQQLPVLDLCAWQATLGLAILDWSCLVRLADRAEGWFPGHLLLAPLPLVDAFRLATASRNGYVRFAALERIVKRETRDLLFQEETALRNLLLVLAKDEDGWPGWLAVCNCYPVRHPHMQAALGRALARSGKKAIDAYVNSIWLSTSDNGGRQCVTQCLSVFRAEAGIARRRALWRKVFDRWQAWDFAAKEKQSLTALATSALDYGVVGWLIESEPREQLINLAACRI